MLTKKLLAAVGLAGALLLGASTDASANPWHGRHFHPVPVHRVSVYSQPVFVPAPRVAVYPAPVYGPAYRPVGWRHHPHWVRPHAYRW